jgi:hypothetical protein
MYKNTKSTSHSSIERKKTSSKDYLIKIYENSKTIFVGRDIVSLKLFGEIPSAPPLALISSNKKYLSKIGYLETYISGLPDWFLFHPRIGVLIRCLREVGRTNPKVIPFELKLIAFGEPPKKIEARQISNIKSQSLAKTINHSYKSTLQTEKTPFEIAFEKAKKLTK